MKKQTWYRMTGEREMRLSSVEGFCLGLRDERTEKHWWKAFAVAFPCFSLTHSSDPWLVSQKSRHYWWPTSERSRFFSVKPVLLSLKIFISDMPEVHLLPQEDGNWATGLKHLAYKKTVCPHDCRCCKLFTLVTVTWEKIKGYHQFCRMTLAASQNLLWWQPPVLCSLAVLPTILDRALLTSSPSP